MKRFLSLLPLLGVALACEQRSNLTDVEFPQFSGVTKVGVCHSEGNGTFHLVSISDKALPAHIDHGDGQPGDPVPGQSGKQFGADCSIEDALVTVTSVSGPQNFSGTGWGGNSCPPEYPNVVAGGVSKTSTEPWTPADYLVDYVLAEPGATLHGYTFPVFPHYTYGTGYAGETGVAVHNGGTSQSLYVYVVCSE